MDLNNATLKEAGLGQREDEAIAGHAETAGTKRASHEVDSESLAQALLPKMETAGAGGLLLKDRV